METGVVIVAAGMSSRMGDFKPMLNIGSISIAQRIIATFKQAGVERIVVVTGYNADVLEHHLAKCGVVFLRNEQYQTTQMFDSARIGLQYLFDKCDRVFFTPVDIPLFTAGTVSKLLHTGAELACPVCRGKRGHPILMSSHIIEKVLADSGENGMAGALSRCGVPVTEVIVDDAGILHDADTPADYQALLEYHNSQLIRPEAEVSLSREKPFFDARTAMLLELIDETSSVRKACQRMQLSYSSGWNTLNTLEEQLGCALVERCQGGSGGGKSVLTPKGVQLLERYNRFRADVKAAADRLFDLYFADIL
ncbi:MAG: NTP transferase domain-containing protein [Christensenellales bacterium]|jgi:molybdenum cofactor cytidylyltransferase